MNMQISNAKHNLNMQILNIHLHQYIHISNASVNNMQISILYNNIITNFMNVTILE